MRENLRPNGENQESSYPAVNNESRLLKDIVRPYSLPVELEDHGNALLIDNKIVLAFRNLLDHRAWKLAQIRDITKTLLVSREKTLPIIIQKDGSEFMVSYANEEELRGKFGTVFVYERSRPRVSFIGEDYKIIFQPTREPNMRLIIDSVSPIRTKRISSSLNYDAYLEELASNSHF